MALSHKNTTASIPALADTGIPHVAGAAEMGVCIQATASVTLSGSSPHTIAFADLTSQSGGEFKAPIDEDYVVLISGDTAAVMDLTTRTTVDFDITGGSASDEVAFVIIGRFAGVKRSA